MQKLLMAATLAASLGTITAPATAAADGPVGDVAHEVVEALCHLNTAASELCKLIAPDGVDKLTDSALAALREALTHMHLGQRLLSAINSLHLLDHANALRDEITHGIDKLIHHHHRPPVINRAE